MKIKISLVAVSCLIALAGWAQPEKVLRFVSGGQVIKEYKVGEYDAIEYQDSETVVGEINGYEYVDLGLPSGLKWASCNLGANSPEEYGDYYQWGEIDVETEYTQANCSTWLVDGPDDISGDPEHDVARANWGASWRMPTRAELNELLDFGEWQDGVLNGVAGMKVTGPNGNYIFLPYTGFKSGTKLSGTPGGGYLWSATGSGKYNAYRVGYAVRSQSQIMQSKYLGIPIRPVSN